MPMQDSDPGGDVSSGRKTILGFAVAALAFATAEIAQATTWSVDASGGADFSTIADAVAAAADGDTILVEPGLYSGQIDPAGAEVIIRSVAGPSVTQITATTSSCVRFASSETPSNSAINMAIFKAAGGTARFPR